MKLKKVKKSVKKTITEHIDKNLLVRLSFNKDEITKLKWEHSKEFEHKSEMYDIVHKEIKSDSIIYWCWLDNEETQLEKSLNILIANTSSEFIYEINRCLSNPDICKKIGENAIKLIETEYSNDSISKNFLAFLYNVTNSKN